MLAVVNSIIVVVSLLSALLSFRLQESPGPDSTARDSSAAEAETSPPDSTAAEPPVVEPLSETESSTSPSEAAVPAVAPETPEERKKRLAEVALHIGPWIRLLLDQDQQHEVTDGDAAQAAESEDKKIMVFQMPGALGQTYAVIRLTPGVDAAMSPMKSLITSGRLDAIANSLSDLMKQSASEKEATETSASDASPKVPAEVTVAEAPPAEATPAEAADKKPEYPAWYPKPDGARLIAETEPVLPGEDPTEPLVKALNKALSEHLLTFADQLDPVFGAEARTARFELDAATAKSCIVDSFEREEQFVSDVGGPQPFRKVYALVEFPESIDKIALARIRETVQEDRVTGLIVVVAFGWMSVCIAGLGIRLWNRGSWLRRGLSLPIFILVAVPMMLVSLAVGITLGRGETARFPWKETAEPVQIRIEQSA